MVVVHYPGCQPIFPPSDVSTCVVCGVVADSTFARTARCVIERLAFFPRSSITYQRDSKWRVQNTCLPSRIDNDVGSLWAGRHGERKMDGRDRLRDDPPVSVLSLSLRQPPSARGRARESVNDSLIAAPFLKRASTSAFSNHGPRTRC